MDQVKPVKLCKGLHGNKQESIKLSFPYSICGLLTKVAELLSSSFRICILYQKKYLTEVDKLISNNLIALTVVFRVIHVQHYVLI